MAKSALTQQPPVALIYMWRALLTQLVAGQDQIRGGKKNIEPLGNSLDKVNQLQGVNYDWRIDEYPDQGFTEERQIDLIAQDVEEVIPEIVHANDDGYKSVSYEKLTAVLVEAAKEQQSQIEEPKAENEELRALVGDLLTRLRRPGEPKLAPLESCLVGDSAGRISMIIQLF